MIKIREAVIVEGRYDKIKLRAFIDAPIIETNGFRVFKDKEKQLMIRKSAEKRGLLVITDSDSAGFVIRNFLRGIVPPDKIRHCYIPQIAGKEKRKAVPSKEGYLGVEGLTEQVILEALKQSGVTLDSQTNETNGSSDENGKENPEELRDITKADMYDLGLIGRENSAVFREKVLKHFGFPTYLSTNAMCSALNCVCTVTELQILLEQINNQ